MKIESVTFILNEIQDSVSHLRKIKVNWFFIFQMKFKY